MFDAENTIKSGADLEVRPDNEDSASTFSDRVALLYESLPLALSAILVNGAILSAVQWSTAGKTRVTIWFAFTLLIVLLRAGLYYAFRRQAPADRATHSSRWLNLFLIGVLGSGLLWGSTGYFFFPANEPTHQLFVVFIVGGMAAGAITTLSASFTAIMLFLVPALGPLIVLLFLGDSPLSATMSGMVALFLLMLTTTAWRSNQLIIESLRRHYARERAEATLRFQVYHDSLTGLPNRRLLVDRLEQEVARCKRHHYMAAVLFIDIDRFKTINDSLGHVAGDALLREIATRLRASVRKEDTAARLGGDEFVVVLPELGSDEVPVARKAGRLARKIAHILSESYLVDERALHVTSSIGIALCPVDGDTDANEILKQADIAMYRAKELGRNTIQFYQPDMQIAINKRLVLENELRVALQRNEMELYFQPQLDIDGRIVSAEALLRWNNPERGLVSPGDFIPIAEETGIILPLGEWVLHAACTQLKSWMDSADLGQIKRFPGIAINVSPRQFQQVDFFQRVQRIIEQTGVDPRYVELELTEGMLTENIEDTARKMEQLSNLGVLLAIDDFGTGYSSLYFLKRLRLDRIKIDQSFIRDVTTDASSATIVQTIILMAHNLGLNVIAEGVETETELRFLRERGCNSYQGYYFSKPLPRDTFFRYLTDAC